MKKCNKCGLTKPLDDFSSDKSKSDGKCTRCKSCVTAYRAANKAIISEQRKAYRAANAESIANYMKEYKPAYRSANRDRLSYKSSEWAKLNPERAKVIRANSRKRNKEASNSITRKRRAALRNASGVHTKQDIEQLFQLQRGQCACCRSKIGKYHVDHIVPLAGGGSNDKANLQLLCPACNTSKGARVPEEFMQTRGYLC